MATLTEALDQVKNQIDIVDYIGAFTSLKRAGRNFKALCPFHQESTPSFVVSPDRQIWRCFGACQQGGDVVSFLMKMENSTFYEAVLELAKRIGVHVDTSTIDDEQWKAKETLLKVNNMAVKFYNYILTKHKSGKLGLDYVTKRGLGDKLIESFQLGFAPNSWSSLSEFLRKKGFSNEVISQAGLSLKGTSGRYYDRFRNRLMFPIYNAQSQVAGFSGRLIAEEEQKEGKSKEAKYVNTPETPVYRKRETLFGLQLAKEHIIKEKIAIITEGEFDMISCYKNGLSNAVAIKGSAFTKEQLQLLKRYTSHLVLALDADFSGTETTKRAIMDAEELDFRIEVIPPYDFAKDPDEALSKDPIQFKKLAKHPMPIYDFIIELSARKHGTTDAYAKKNITEEVIPFLMFIMNPIVKSHYVKKLAEILSVKEKDIEVLLYRNKKKKAAQPAHSLAKRAQNVPEKDRYQQIQEYILGTIFQHEKPLELIKKTKQDISAADFDVPAYQELFTALLDFETLAQKNNTTLPEFIKTLSDPLMTILDELTLIEVQDIQSDDQKKHFERSLLELKRHSLKIKIKKFLEGTDVNEKNEETVDAESAKELAKELSDVEKRLLIL